MGIACAEKNMDYDTLFTMADTAMYNVKRDSKGNYRFYDSAMKIVLRDSENS